MTPYCTTSSRRQHERPLFGVFVSLCACCLAVLSCATAGPEYSDEDLWLNDDSFSVVAYGHPEKKPGDIQQRRDSAKKWAIFLARYRIEQRIGNLFPVRDTDYPKRTALKKAIDREFGAIISSGTVTMEQYDTKQICRIRYVISSPGLKKKIYEEFDPGID